MFYYAEINDTFCVTAVHALDAETTATNYVNITEDQYTNGNLVGKYYNRLTGAFEFIDYMYAYVGDSHMIRDRETEYPLSTKIDNIIVDINGKADANHTHDFETYTHPASHPASMITGLAAVATSGSYTDLSDKPTIPTVPTSLPANGGNADTVDGKHAADFATATHAHSDYATNEDLTALETTVNGKANATHSHAQSDITGLASALSGKANVTHTHSDYVTNTDFATLEDTVDGKANASHAHAQSDITGLATALSGKASTSHTHSNYALASDLNALSETVTGKVDKVDGKALSTNDFTTAEKNKLAGIATGANAYTHPSYTAKSSGLYKVTVDGTGHVSGTTAVSKADITALGIPSTNTTYSNATTSTAGLMSAADKSDFDTAKSRGQIGVCKNVLTTGENLDDYIYSGTYTFGGSYTPENIPAGSNGWLVVLRWSCADENATVKQLWFRHGTVGTNDFEIYVRTKIGTAAFGSWSKIYTTSNPPTAAEVGAISKDLQMTADNGDAELKLSSGSSDNLLTKIKALGMGMHTYYSASGNAGNPKTTEAWRGLVFKTGASYGFVQAYGSIGSVYTNYLDGDTWRGWKCIYDNSPAPLWTGAKYMSSPNSTPQVVTPSKSLSECRNGWLLLWSDYDKDTSTANDSDFVTTMIPKRNPSGGTWGGKAFLCDIPRYIGSNVEDVDTERRIIKSIYIHDDCIKGSYNNDKDERNDVVLRAVYEF